VGHRNVAGCVLGGAWLRLLDTCKFSCSKLLVSLVKCAYVIVNILNNTYVMKFENRKTLASM
jgi:hypothetical protein